MGLERKKASGILLILLLIGMLVLAFDVGLVWAGGTIYIRPDGSVYPPTAPISRDGDVYTFTDNINDNIVVQRDNIVVVGADFTLQSPGDGRGIDLSSRNNVTITNMQIDGFAQGVYLAGSHYNKVQGNNITNNGLGIYLHSSSNNILAGNSMTNNINYSISLQADSSHNIIRGNNIMGSYFGVELYESSNNLLSRNNITANFVSGIWLSSSSNNTFAGNNILANDFCGVELSAASDNLFYHNNFVDNTDHVETDGSANAWDDGYHSGGNFWSDYLGVDLYSGPGQDEPGRDGIGDTSYVIDETNLDVYPLMEPWHARICVDPIMSYAMVGEVFQIGVEVAEVTDLYGFEFVVGYNKAVLDAMEVFVQPFLNEPIDILGMEINEELGYVWIDVASQPPAEPAYGSGTLATIFFQVIGSGECVLDLHNTRLSDPEGFPIDHSVEDGYYEGGMTQVVSTESTGWSANPSVSVGSDGVIHIAWHDSTDYRGSGTDCDIFYKRYQVGVGWTMTEVVSTESTMHSYYPSLAVDLAGNVHVAWEDLTDYGGSGIDKDIFYKRYVVGVGWTTTEVVSAESTGDSLRPSLAVDSDGNVHIAWQDYTNYGGSGSDVDIFYRRRVVGVGWTSTEVVSTESTENSSMPSLDVDSSGNAHVAWHDPSDYGGPYIDIFYKRRVVGVGWTSTEVVSTESTTGHSYVPSLAVDSDGNVHIAWYDHTDYGGAGADYDIFYKRYVVGVGWTSTEVVSTESTDGSGAPSLAVDLAGNVHVAWEDQTDYAWAGTDDDIFYKRYQVGVGWTNTAVVSTESTDGSGAPSLAVDLAGNVHVAWEDQTDYAGCGTDWDILYKHLRVQSTQYPWPMFHHNLRHTGYTESPAPETNQTLWSYATGDDVLSSPAIVDGRVYVGSFDDNVYCLDASTGAHIWNYTTGNDIDSSPAVVDGRVYVGSDDNKIYCLNAFTGAHIWNYTTGDNVWSSLAVVDGRVYVGSDDNKIYCLNAFTGAHIWNYTTGGWAGSPAVASGKVYVVSWDRKVYCLDASTGLHVWNYTTGGFVESSAAVVDGKVYVGSWDSKVYCLDASTGAHIWNHTTGGGVISSPAVACGRVYVGSWDDKVYCLNASTGTHIWNYTTGGNVYSSPAVADGKVYVGSFDNKTYCLDASTGTHIWNYTTGGNVWSSPAVADGIVFVGSDDDAVYAFGNVIKVPEDHPTIQEAIDAANPGDTISIAPGTYHESLVIDKPLTLLGRKGSSTTFAGGGSGIAVTIADTSYVTITNIDITYWTQGIFIDNSSDCQIYSNVMYLMGDSGVVVDGENAANNQIYNNIFQDNNIAIDVSASSTGNIIYGNTITQNTIGINVLNSGGNTIYCNSFINNGQQVNIASQPNAWDFGGLGNYWSNYDGTDADGDGIGDTPYVIDGSNKDDYPLMSPYGYWSNPMSGDVNMDMMVNYEDLFQLATAYGSTPQKPNWNANCDLNRNDKIEVLDLFNLCKNYGRNP